MKKYLILIAAFAALSCSKKQEEAPAERKTRPEVVTPPTEVPESSEPEAAKPPIDVVKAKWTVKNAGAPVNSKYHDGFPFLSEDGLVMYFASDRHTESDELTAWLHADFDIYVTHRESRDAPWKEPRRLPAHINTKGKDHSVTMSPDGHWMYFSSTGLGGCGKLDLFRSYRKDVTDDLGWEKPENLGCEVNSPDHDVCAIYFTDAGKHKMVFVSDRANGKNLLDMYETTLDEASGKWRKPTLLEEASSNASDGHLDPTSGFVWTMREGGLGKGDLWHSTRDASGSWQEPVHLGEPLNTPDEEQLPAPIDGGRILFFPSDRPGGEGGLDIYVAEASRER